MSHYASSPQPTQLAEILYQKTNDQLKQLAKLCDACRGATRKDDLVRCIHCTVMKPESLRQVWRQLDDLSKKAVAAAYHNDGEFNQSAFVAQYGTLPERPKKNMWSYYSEPIPLDLFLYDGRLPADLIPLLVDLVPPPDKFQLTGLAEPPQTVEMQGYTLELQRAETEQAGLHDLLAYLRLVEQGQIQITATSNRATVGSLKKLVNDLLVGDFFSLPDKYRATDTIRPFGLDVFAQEAGLVAKARGRNQLQLTDTGREYYQTQNPEILLEAVETWTQQGQFDELSRISALKGLNSRSTRLTAPASRREAVLEALSWCPAGAWIAIDDFYRAVKIWHFDFDVETTYYSNLYVGYRDYGELYSGTYWTVTKGLYINALIWEYLGSIGAVDLLYTHPSDTAIDADLYYDDDYLSLYDGLWYFKINNLGAYLLGQAAEYVPSKPLHEPLFAISSDLRVTLIRPNDLTPNNQNLLAQVAVARGKHYHLDAQQFLTSLETGADADYLIDFLQQRHQGPLPQEVTAWLEKIRHNSQLFSRGEPAVFIKAQSTDLIDMVTNDPVLPKLCYVTGSNMLVISNRKEKAFRARLKELGYILQ
ncbi:MAG: hypothetical protein JXM69_01070 [Anaerolineae bacterium]|nr:hypothetical protein [Anaerolineae bacterium]